MKRSVFQLCAWVLAGMVPLAALAVDPKLDPGTAPAPTFKTLDQIPPTWDQLLLPQNRFKVAMREPGGAFSGWLDLETGLVWQVSVPRNEASLYGAHDRCRTLHGPGSSRKGWRLPSIEELSSVLDLSLGSSFLPGVFRGDVQEGVQYWSSTASMLNPGWFFTIDLKSGAVHPSPASETLNVWCVRGGAGAATQ